MGWHYILTFHCKLLPEYIPFIEKEYLRTLYDTDRDIHYRSGPFYRNYESDNEDRKKRIAELIKMKEEEKENREKEYNLLSKPYKDLIDIWTNLDIGLHFYKYELKGSDFFCQISKKVNWHSGDLQDDYLTFLKDIIVPISTEITDCNIESDDYGDMKWDYTDSQLRNIRFNLQDKIKSIEHIYSEDKSEIYETRVIYKHSIKKINFIDLNREYGFR
jgi:hypothetical protein